MTPVTARFSPAALLLSLLVAAACGGGGGGGPPPAAPEPPLDPRIASLVGTWLVETDNGAVLHGVEAPLGLDNAVMEAVVIWSDPAGRGAAFDLRCADVEAPEFGLGMMLLEIGGVSQDGIGGIYYLPQHDVTVNFETTEATFDSARIDAVAEADVYAGMQIVERQDPISQDYYWDVADGSVLVGRMRFDLPMRR